MSESEQLKLAGLKTIPKLQGHHPTKAYFSVLQRPVLQGHLLCKNLLQVVTQESRLLAPCSCAIWNIRPDVTMLGRERIG